MAKIGLEIKNYKSIAGLEIPLNDYDVIVVEGKNRAGKSSLINGILENITATNLTDEPLKRGEIDGEKKVIIQDKDGKEIVIVHDFDKKSPLGKFYAIQNGEKISSVKKIREILGEVNTYTVDEFFHMCKTIPGRRKFINEILFRCLSDEEKAELTEINSENNSTNGTLFTKRSDIKRQIEVLKAATGLTTEEETILDGKAQLKTDLTSNEVKKAAYADLKSLLNRVIAKCNPLNSLNVSDEELQLIGKLPEETSKTVNAYVIAEKELVAKNDSIKKIIEGCTAKISELDIQISEINTKLDKVKQIEYKKEGADTAEEKLKGLENLLKETQEKIDENIKRKDEILSTSELPKGLQIQDESSFTYNGFNFNENEISESEAWLLLAELTIPIYSCKYFRMGNAAIYGKDALNKLVELAAKYDKIIALERVNDDMENVYVEGMIFEENLPEPTKQQIAEATIATEHKEAVKTESTGDRLIRETAERKTKMAEQFVEDAKTRGAWFEGSDNAANPLDVDFSAEAKAYENGEVINTEEPLVVEKKKEEPIKQVLKESEIGTLDLF